MGAANDRVHEFNMTTPYNINTSVYNGNISIPDATPSDLAFNYDGTILYVMGDGNNLIYQYNLATPWLINSSTGIINTSILGESGVQGVSITGNDSSSIYIVGTISDAIKKMTFRNVSNVSKSFISNDSFYIDGFETAVTAGFVNIEETKMYVTGSVTDMIYEFNKSVSYAPPEPPSNSCTYGGSGDWVINGQDYCNITTNTNLGNNTLIFNGTTGTTRILANISNIGNIFVNHLVYLVNISKLCFGTC